MLWVGRMCGAFRNGQSAVGDECYAAEGFNQLRDFDLRIRIQPSHQGTQRRQPFTDQDDVCTGAEVNRRSVRSIRAGHDDPCAPTMGAAQSCRKPPVASCQGTSC